MIKGVQKNVIIMTDTKSEIFEQAIFIVKKGVPPLSDYTLKKEAERILGQQTDCMSKKGRRK